MHPSQADLKKYLENRIHDTGKNKEIEKHLQICQFCRELADNIGQLLRATKHAEKEDVLPEALALADRLFKDSAARNIIYLKPLEPEQSDKYHQAADGVERDIPDIENIATLYSEQPEIVLQLMRDNKQGLVYFQLIADDERKTSHIMVRIPEKNEEYVTDGSGRAFIPSPHENPASLNWQIKMPEAQFALKPLKYDPNNVEYQNEIDLETERNDKIRVRFEGKTSGKQISIKILALDGKKDFGDLKVIFNQKDKSNVKNIGVDGTVSFDLDESDDEINIRLFQL